MPEIRHPENSMTPPVSSSSPAPPQSADDAPEPIPEPSPWQVAVIRVTVVVAIWLGY